jgi:hypothetical protein
MSAEENLRAELVAHAPLTAFVKRVAVDKVPEKTLRPFVVLTRRETEPITTIDGQEHGRRITFEVQCWGDTRAQAEQCADLVEDALRASNVEPFGIPVDDRASAYDPDLDLECSRLVLDWWE